VVVADSNIMYFNQNSDGSMYLTKIRLHNLISRRIHNIQA